MQNYQIDDLPALVMKLNEKVTELHDESYNNFYNIEENETKYSFIHYNPSTNPRTILQYNIKNLQIYSEFEIINSE